MPDPSPVQSQADDAPAAPSASVEKVDLLSPAAMATRTRDYLLLDQDGPVMPVEVAPGTIVWLVTRYDDVRTALQDPALAVDLSRSGRPQRGMSASLPADLVPYYRQSLPYRDPPEHTRLRRLVSTPFTARRVEALRPRIGEITQGLLDAMAAEETVDLIEAFATPLPTQVICDLLGVPEARQAQMRDFTATLMLNTAESAALMVGAARGLKTLVEDVVAERRRAPGPDFLSALVRLRDEEQDITDVDLVAMALSLVVAGHETTVNLLGNAVLGLLSTPDQWAALVADPALVPPAVEEVLRLYGPASRAGYRYTVAPVTIDGVTIPAGETVLLWLSTANRDSRRFSCPGELQVSRAESPHLAFGHGVHFCLGAALARAEAEIALSALTQRFPRLELAVPAEEIRWRSSSMRGAVELPVRPVPA